MKTAIGTFALVLAIAGAAQAESRPDGKTPYIAKGTHYTEAASTLHQYGWIPHGQVECLPQNPGVCAFQYVNRCGQVNQYAFDNEDLLFAKRVLKFLPGRELNCQLNRKAGSR